MGSRSLQFGRHVKCAVAAIIGLAAIPTASNAEAPSDHATEQQMPDRGGFSMREAFLKEHNRDRRAAGHQPLVWDDSLANDAKKWADHLAVKRMFEHARQQLGDTMQGENLWMGTRGAYTPEEMVGLWLAEGEHAQPGIFPNISATGDWRDIGHFTQMLWPSTRAVGCALSSNAEDDVLVCRYFPAGNRIGDRFDPSPRR
jgi:hypothetical protein